MAGKTDLMQITQMNDMDCTPVEPVCGTLIDDGCMAAVSHLLNHLQ